MKKSILIIPRQIESVPDAIEVLFRRLRQAVVRQADATAQVGGHLGGLDSDKLCIEYRDVAVADPYAVQAGQAAEWADAAASDDDDIRAVGNHLPGPLHYAVGGELGVDEALAPCVLELVYIRPNAVRD